MIGAGTRWRRVSSSEVGGLLDAIASWPSPIDGAVRHMFPLAAIERRGASAVRIVGDPARAVTGEGFAAVVVVESQVVAPLGDPRLIARAGSPVRHWRLLVGDRAAGDALLAEVADEPGLIVHDQRYLTVDPDAVPHAADVADPGLRRAVAADVDGLARLAVRLHVDDRFGPDPGLGGYLGYRSRALDAVARGLAWCVGPEGGPRAKLERSVSSARWGVQLAGIVVEPESRGQGLGTAMVAAAVRDALAAGPVPVSLHVRDDNAPALAAYAAAGFGDREAWRLALRP